MVQKRQKDISHIDDKIIAMYATGLSTWQISEQIEDIYSSMLVKVWFQMLPTSFLLKLRIGSTVRYPESTQLYLSMQFTFLLETIT